MKLSGLVRVLGALLPLASFAAAEPIPVEASGAFDASLDPADIFKRAFGDDPYGDNGVGPRYWAWAKLAYDGDYNGQTGRTLGDAAGKPWAKLAGSEIEVKGFVGPRLEAGITPWPTLTGMKGIVALDKTEKVIVLGFIGSNDRPTFKSDFKFQQIRAQGIAGEVSKGFYQCFESVYTQLFEWVKEYADANPDWKIVISGHSLGGATAHIAAVKLAFSYPDFKDRTWVFTYGAPRAGDLVFQKKLEMDYGDRMFNYRHVNDAVPYLPFIHQSPVDTYANPPRRAIFTPSGKESRWQDASLWNLQPNADEGRAGLTTAAVTLAKNVKHRGEEHTGYFSEAFAPSKRSINVNKRGRHAKRDAPSYDDRIAAEAALSSVKQQHELSEPPSEIPPKVDEFIKDLGLANQEAEILEELQIPEDTEQDRIDFLKLVEIFAMERA